MSPIRISDAANLLGVSDDTIRRWIAQGSLHTIDTKTGPKTIDGAELADFARKQANQLSQKQSENISSARNKLVGLVTKVTTDKVMSSVEMQCGPFVIVSLMSTESVKELDLRPGKIATAVIKATTVIVETGSAP